MLVSYLFGTANLDSQINNMFFLFQGNVIRDAQHHIGHHSGDISRAHNKRPRLRILRYSGTSR